jgi:hypothetical protein
MAIMAYYADNLPPGVSSNDVAREPKMTMNQLLAAEYSDLALDLGIAKGICQQLRTADNPNDEVVEALRLIDRAADMLKLRAVKLAATVAAPDAEWESEMERARRLR